MQGYGIFTEEVIHSWMETGRISTTFSPEEARDRILSSLGRTIRFNGMMKVPVSVLEHSWMVGVLAEDYALTSRMDERSQKEARLMGMMHDVGEAIVGDVVWPLKSGEFREAYERNYLPLERTFRTWAGGYAFGIEDFGSRYYSMSGFVEMADKFVGDMEMFGASDIADYGFHAYAARMFSEIDVGAEKFLDAVEYLKSETGRK